MRRAARCPGVLGVGGGGQLLDRSAQQPGHVHLREAELTSDPGLGELAPAAASEASDERHEPLNDDVARPWIASGVEIAKQSQLRRTTLGHSRNLLSSSTNRPPRLHR